ncbi:hypothetical protein ACJX0J_026408, partial [Zea mays]
LLLMILTLTASIIAVTGNSAFMMPKMPFIISKLVSICYSLFPCVITSPLSGLACLFASLIVAALADQIKGIIYFWYRYTVVIIKYLDT